MSKMVYQYTVTDDIIAYNVDDVIDDAKGYFPDVSGQTWQDIREECIAEIIDKYDLYQYEDNYSPNYRDIVWDMLKLYGVEE